MALSQEGKKLVLYWIKKSNKRNISGKGVWKFGILTAPIDYSNIVQLLDLAVYVFLHPRLVRNSCQ